MLTVNDLKSRLRRSLEDRLLTKPTPFFRPSIPLTSELAAAADAAVRQIRKASAFFAGERLTADELRQLRQALNNACNDQRPELPVTVNSRTGIIQFQAPLRLHPLVLKLATDPFLCSIVERYLRRRIFLADVDVRRIPAMNMSELDRRADTRTVGATSSHWHRDIRGRQLKVMLYLTTVGEPDSNFVFLPGTHRGHHVRPNSLKESRFTDEWVQGMGTVPVECHGPAGTAMIFDTNLIHRLRRKETASVRDSVTFYYTPGQELRKLEVDPEVVATLPVSARSLFGGRRLG